MFSRDVVTLDYGLRVVMVLLHIYRGSGALLGLLTQWNSPLKVLLFHPQRKTRDSMMFKHKIPLLVDLLASSSISRAIASRFL